MSGPRRLVLASALGHHLLACGHALPIEDPRPRTYRLCYLCGKWRAVQATPPPAVTDLVAPLVGRSNGHGT